MNRRFYLSDHACERYWLRIDQGRKKKEILKEVQDATIYPEGRQMLRQRASAFGKDGKHLDYILLNETTGAVFVCSIEGVSRYTVITVLRKDQLGTLPSEP